MGYGLGVSSGFSVECVAPGVFVVRDFFVDVDVLLGEVWANEGLFFSRYGDCVRRFRFLCGGLGGSGVFGVVRGYELLLGECVSGVFGVSGVVSCAPVSENLVWFDVSVYGVGCGLGLHSDVGGGGGGLLLSSVHYLCDGFVGGEVVFPDLGVSVVPERNLLLVFESGLRHFSSVVVSGVKVCSPRFWRVGG